MTRYLKFVKMKAADGKAITPPACCIVCRKSLCPLSCPEYEAAIGNVKCTQFEMEFGLVDEKHDVVCKCIWKVILFVIVGCMPLSLYLISQSAQQKFDVSVERYAIDKVTGTTFGISYSGAIIDTNIVKSAVGTATEAIAKGSKNGR